MNVLTARGRNDIQHSNGPVDMSWKLAVFHPPVDAGSVSTVCDGALLVFCGVVRVRAITVALGSAIGHDNKSVVLLCSSWSMQLSIACDIVSEIWLSRA